MYAGHWMPREHSWLTNEYSSSVRHDESAAAFLHRIRTAVYSWTEQRHLIDDMASTRFENGTRGTLLESGFPLRSFEAWEIEFNGWFKPEATPHVERSALVSLAPPGSRTGSSYRWIPLIPRWPAILINAACWSLAFHILHGVLLTARRAARLRRNHCPHCNYDLHATPRDKPCPECGQSR
jgi:hypothetical protein